jgi:stage II sporulation protein D
MGGTPKKPEVVRVALIKGADVVKVEGNGVLASDENGEPIGGNSPFYVNATKDGLTVNGKTLHRFIASGPLFVTVNGRKYRGIMEISPADKGVLVVNELPLEDYLVGLINCEISSQWPMEAVKAQAVVARSYAAYQIAMPGNTPCMTWNRR